MNKTFTSIQKIALLFSVAAVGFTSCKKESKPEQADMLIKHMSPDMAAIDVAVDGKKVNATSLSYNTNTGYLKVNAGARTIKITNHFTGAVLVNKSVTVTKDKNYSFVMANRSTNLEGILLEDFQGTAAAGKAHVRIVNLSPDAPAYNTTLSTSATTNTFSGTAFRSASNFVAMDAVTAGTAVSFQVRNPSTNAIATTVNTTLMPGKIYTIVVRGFVTPPNGNTNTLGSTLVTNR